MRDVKMIQVWYVLTPHKQDIRIAQFEDGVVRINYANNNLSSARFYNLTDDVPMAVYHDAFFTWLLTQPTVHNYTEATDLPSEICGYLAQYLLTIQPPYLGGM